MQRTCIHATTISLNGIGVIIRGSSGTGKSDLALQVLEGTGTGLTGKVIATALVADDQTEIWLENGSLMADAPAILRHLLEVRGQGLIQLQSTGPVPVGLVVDLKPVAMITRLPEPEDLTTKLLGLSLPAISIDPSKPSAAARLRTAWARLSLSPASSLTLAPPQGAA